MQLHNSSMTSTKKTSEIMKYGQFITKRLKDIPN